VSGKLLEKNQISGKETILDMSKFLPASYILKVIKTGNPYSQDIRTFKIIKN
jgi:hypothetical protein